MVLFDVHVRVYVEVTASPDIIWCDLLRVHVSGIFCMPALSLHRFPELEFDFCPCTWVAGGAPALRSFLCHGIYHIFISLKFLIFPQPRQKNDVAGTCRMCCVHVKYQVDSVPFISVFARDIVLVCSNGVAASGAHKQIEMNLFLVVNSVIFWMFYQACHLPEAPTTELEQCMCSGDAAGV